ERHLPRVLHGGGHVPLVLRAVPGHPPRPDLAPLRDELPEQGRVLVVHVRDAVLAELAELSLAAPGPALLLLRVLARPLLRRRARPTRHPVASPRSRRRRLRPGPPNPRTTPRRRIVPASPPSRWPISGSDRPRRPRSRSPSASRRPGSPRTAAEAGPRRSRWLPA